MTITNFRGDLTDISAKIEALPATLRMIISITQNISWKLWTRYAITVNHQSLTDCRIKEPWIIESAWTNNVCVHGYMSHSTSHRWSNRLSEELLIFSRHYLSSHLLIEPITPANWQKIVLILVVRDTSMIPGSTLSRFNFGLKAKVTDAHLPELFWPVVGHAHVPNKAIQIAVRDTVDHSPFLKRSVLRCWPMQLANGDIIRL